MFPAVRPIRRALSVLSILAVTFAVTACGGQQALRGYGPEAEANFVDACTTTRTISDGEQVVSELAPEPYCECVYDGIANKYQLPFDELKEYEKEVADADEGDLPDPPEQLTKSIDECSRQGPEAPSSDEGDGADESTTTEG